MRAIGIVAAVLAYGRAAVALTIPAVEHDQSTLHQEDFSKKGGERHTPKLIIEDQDGTPGTVRPRRLQGRFLHISGTFSDRCARLSSALCYLGVANEGSNTV